MILHFSDEEIREIVVAHVVDKYKLHAASVLSTTTSFRRVSRRFERPRLYEVTLSVEVDEGAAKKNV